MNGSPSEELLYFQGLHQIDKFYKFRICIFYTKNGLLQSLIYFEPIWSSCSGIVSLKTFTRMATVW